MFQINLDISLSYCIYCFSLLKDLDLDKILFPLSTKYMSTLLLTKSDNLHASSTPVGPAPAIIKGSEWLEELLIEIINS